MYWVPHNHCGRTFFALHSSAIPIFNCMNVKLLFFKVCFLMRKMTWQLLKWSDIMWKRLRNRTYMVILFLHASVIISKYISVHFKKSGRIWPKCWLYKSPVDTIFPFVSSKFLLFYKGCFKLSTIDIWGKTILYCGGCLVSYRMFSNITGLHPLDANSTPQLWQPKGLQTLLNVPWGEKLYPHRPTPPLFYSKHDLFT